MKSPQQRTLMDNDANSTETVSICTHTYSSDNHLIAYKRGLVELNCSTLVNFRCRNGQHFSGVLKVSSIPRWTGRSGIIFLIDLESIQHKLSFDYSYMFLAPFSLYCKKNCKTNKKNKSFVRLPQEVKVVRHLRKVTFDVWKQLNFPLEGDAHAIYRAKCKDYRSRLPRFSEPPWSR